MKFNITTRIKIFMIAVCVIVSGQMFYSYKNVKSFQRDYIETLQVKCRKLGGFLRDEVEYALKLNIPFTKLFKLENTLKEILDAIPESEFIEVIDSEGYVLYYADHQSMRRIEPGKERSSNFNKEATFRIKDFGLMLRDVDTILPVYHTRKERYVGHIKMRLSPEVVVGKSREILLDMITVILTSLLITFELLTFFISYSLTDPLEKLVREVEYATGSLSPLPAEALSFVGKLADLIQQFNDYAGKLADNLKPFISVQQFFPEAREKITASVQKQSENLEYLISHSSACNTPALEEMLERLPRVRQRADSLGKRLSLYEFSDTPADRAQAEEKKLSKELASYSYIRPLIFLFLMADGFSVSFFPMFVDTLYEPLPWFSREMVLGLPISIYMFFLALSMPLSGILSDKIGWYKPLIAGIFLNAIGMFLTAMAQNIYQLILFRSITATGFGMVVMCAQGFVIDRTAAHNRSAGMAAFIAAFFSGDLCGTVVGGMLANRFDYRHVFLLSGLFSLFALICALLIFKREFRNPSGKKTISARFSFKHVFHVIMDREFFSVLFFQAIPAKLILVGFLFYFTPLYLKQIGTLQSNIGRVLMCYGLVLALLSPLLSKFSDKESYREYYIFAGGMISGLAMIAFYFYPGFFPILFTVAIIGLAHTFSVPSQSTLITETPIVRKIGAGAGVGLFRFWERAGNIAGPLLIGFLIGKVGYERSVAVLGVISVVCSMLYILIVKARKPSSGSEIVLSNPES